MDIKDLSLRSGSPTLRGAEPDGCSRITADLICRLIATQQFAIG